MSTFIHPASRASAQLSPQQKTAKSSSSTSQRTESQTRELVSELLVLNNSELEQFFSQQSNEDLGTLASDIDPSLTTNGGLSADERRDLFNHLATTLSSRELKHWRELLSQGLSAEFDVSVRAFAHPSIGAEIGAELTLQSIDTENSSASETAPWFESERPYALLQVDQPTSSSVELTTQEQ